MRSHSGLSRTLLAVAGGAAAIAIAVLGSGCLTKAQPRTAATAELEVLIDSFLNQRWEESPAAATEAGVSGYDDRLPDLSAKAVSAREAQERELLGAVQHLTEQSLSGEEQIDRQLLIGQLESSIRENERRRPSETNPELYVPFGALSGLIGKEEMPIAERARGLTARLTAAPTLFAQGRLNLKQPPRAFTAAAIFTAEGTISFIQDNIPAFAVRAGAAGRDLSKAADDAVTSLKAFRDFLKIELLPRSNGSWVIGKDDYDFILKRRWFLDGDADTILARGRQVFDDIERQLQETANRISPSSPWVQVYERLKDDHPPADRLKEAYQTQIEAAQAYLKAHDIVTLPPGERVETIDTPPAMRRSSPFGTFHSVGPFEKRMVGQLNLTPIDDTLTQDQRRERLRSHHTAWIPLIAVHEAYPGHHVQALKTNENPRVLRRVVKESIFSEGWGLYCEELMWELGFLHGDDVRLTQLRNRLWRAARVIIDVSLHTGRMTFEQGVDFLVEKVGFERYGAELEVGMYTRRPTYVLGYLIGMLEIQDMRAKWEQKYGTPARPREFVDKLLRIGAIPPGLVRRELLAPPVSAGSGR